MTDQEAIAELSRRAYRTTCYGNKVLEHEENLVAIKALEKTAKKPQKNGLYSAHSGIFRKIPAYTCPSCGNMCLEKWATERNITSYCWDCGQKLDWSDEE